MTDGETPGTALARTALAAPAELMGDDEMRRLFRIAEALAKSGMFKSVTKAEHAFAKLVVGRDLGMSPAQAMQGLHIVEGGVQVHYAMLGQFIRARADDGYDYRTGWLKVQPKITLPNQPDRPAERVVVWAAEDDPADSREIVGAVVEFTVHGKLRGVSRFTYEDAMAAKLIKDSDRSAWNTARRNMYLARAMSNGVKWFVPEVMGGLPIYAEGEIVPSGDLSAGEGSGAVQGLDLGPKVEWVITRAEELGHAGYSDRAAVEVALGSRSPDVVNAWVDRAKQELQDFEARQTAEPEEATVVDENPPPPEAAAAPDGIGQQPPSGPAAGDTKLARELEASVLVNRLRGLRAIRAEEQDPEKRPMLDEELDHIEAAIRELGVEVPEE